LSRFAGPVRDLGVALYLETIAKLRLLAELSVGLRLEVLEI
jgi:hypothetical protein